jgi:hypothetical protein
MLGKLSSVVEILELIERHKVRLLVAISGLSIPPTSSDT